MMPTTLHNEQVKILKENIQKADREIAELDRLIEMVREVSLK